MKHQILIIDDDMGIRMNLKEVFEFAGFATTLAGSLGEARDELKRNSFELIVLDITLPDGNGLDFLEDVRQDKITANVPVIILSSHRAVQDRTKGLVGGANEYIEKPFKINHMVSRAFALIGEQWGKNAPLGSEESAPSQITDEAPAPMDVVVEESHAEENIVEAPSMPATPAAPAVSPGAFRDMSVLASENILPGEPSLEVVAGGKGSISSPPVLGAPIAPRAEGTDVRNGVKDSSRGGVRSTRKILLVDDSMTLRQALELRLQQEKYRVFTAESGEKALEVLAVEPVDCILLDSHMSGIGGQETCRQIKDSMAWRHIPVIFLTAEADRDFMLKAFELGADDYVLKSSDFEVLHARVLAQLRRKYYEDENKRIREQMMRQEMEAGKARSAEELAAARALLLIELGQKNSELEQAKAEATRESLFKTKFLANMSHELRTPLNAIIGFSELLEQKSYGPLAPRQEEYVQNIIQSGHHLLSLVTDILDLSKIEAGRMTLSREWISLNVVIDAVEQVVKTLADKQGVGLEISVPSTLPDIYVDPVRIRQVLYNLLSNAIKFTPKGGLVKLSAGIAEDNRIEIVIEDSGIGISPEDVQRLFREFERVEPGPGAKLKAQGTGLGLALTKQLVELHGGTVMLKSHLDKGTKVTVTLPTLRGEPVTKVILSSDAGPAKSTVLVVENDIHAAELLANYLRAVGLSVAFALDAEAISYTQEFLPGAVILDILMPGQDGWSILNSLKTVAATASIPVLVTSVLDEAGRGAAQGAADYLVKPIAPDTLWHALERAGVRLFRISGVRVFLVDGGNVEINTIEEHLHVAGCDVQRIRPEDEFTVPSQPDLIVVDLLGDPTAKREKARALFEKMGISPLPPILALQDTENAETQTLGPKVDRITWVDAMHLERFVRAANKLAHRDQPVALLEPRTGLPSPESLLEYLNGCIQRAERDLKRILVITAAIEFPTTPTLGSWEELLHPRLRRTDYLAIVNNTLFLVVYGAVAHESTPIAERFTYVLKQALHLTVSEVHIFWYPTDGRKAQDLLDKCVGAVPVERGHQ